MFRQHKYDDINIIYCLDNDFNKLFTGLYAIPIDPTIGIGPFMDIINNVFDNLNVGTAVTYKYVVFFISHDSMFDDVVIRLLATFTF